MALQMGKSRDTHYLEGINCILKGKIRGGMASRWREYFCSPLRLKKNGISFTMIFLMILKFQEPPLLKAFCTFSLALTMYYFKLLFHACHSASKCLHRVKELESWIPVFLVEHQCLAQYYRSRQYSITSMHEWERQWEHSWQPLPWSYFASSYSVHLVRFSHPWNLPLCSLVMSLLWLQTKHKREKGERKTEPP